MENSESSRQLISTSSTFTPDRREFVKLAVGGALSGAALFPPLRPPLQPCTTVSRASNYARKPERSRPISQLLYLQADRCGVCQRGIHARSAYRRGLHADQETYADAGITVWNIGNTSVHNMPEVTLNLPGRDQKIEDYKEYLRNLGKAGIYYTRTRTWATASGAAGAPRFADPVGARVRHGQPQQAGRVGQRGVQGTAFARARVFEGRNLGELHVFH